MGRGRGHTIKVYNLIPLVDELPALNYVDTLTEKNENKMVQGARVTASRGRNYFCYQCVYSVLFCRIDL